MARKVRDVTIRTGRADNRDEGKTYRLTEMASTDAEYWGVRAMLAVGRSGVDIPDEFRQHGMAGIAIVGMKALVGISFEEARPLMDEMMGCVQIVQEAGARAATADGDIEEVETRVFLRGELMELHTGFTVRAAALNLEEAVRNLVVSWIIQTSPSPSDSSSEADSPPSTNLAPSTG